MTGLMLEKKSTIEKASPQLTPKWFGQGVVKMGLETSRGPDAAAAWRVELWPQELVVLSS